MTAVSYSVSNAVATVVMQRPDVKNAIDITLVRELHHALDEIQKGRSAIRAVVLTGTHNVFCSGIDLHYVDVATEDTRQQSHINMRRLVDPLILRMSSFRYPIVAAINGAAVGTGMSLALASSIIVAGKSAYFSPSFARLGLVPDAGITFNLARRIGMGRSLAALMLAEKISADIALEWGLAYAVVEDGELIATAQAIAGKLAALPSEVLREIRELHAVTFNNTLQQQLYAERSAQEGCMDTHDCVEGVRAFFEKREPHFQRK